MYSERLEIERKNKENGEKIKARRVNSAKSRKHKELEARVVQIWLKPKTNQRATFLFLFLLLLLLL